MQDSLGRLVIAPSETNGFLPSTQSVNVIMDSIKSFYLDAWISWGEIPVFDREQMWNHFRTKCAWYPQHDYQIFCNFEVNARYMLNDILESACENNQKPDWMLEGIWAKLNEKWTLQNFKRRVSKQRHHEPPTRVTRCTSRVQLVKRKKGKL